MNILETTNTAPSRLQSLGDNIQFLLRSWDGALLSDVVASKYEDVSFSTALTTLRAKKLGPDSYIVQQMRRAFLQLPSSKILAKGVNLKTVFALFSEHSQEAISWAQKLKEIGIEIALKKPSCCQRTTYYKNHPDFTA